jgi:hypothetical protein
MDKTKFKYIEKGKEKMFIPKIRGKKLFIHDNGGKPFLMIITPEILVFKAKYDYDNKTSYYDKLILRIPKYKKLFIGKDKTYKDFTGNSNLVMLSDFEYIYIGSSIYKFNTKEDITKYVSEVGNSDVPYPFAVTKSFFYLMIENVFYKRNLIPKNPREAIYEYGNNIPYTFYYYNMKDFRKGKLQVNRLVKKMIMKRDF